MNEILTTVRLKRKAAALFDIPLEFDDRVLQTTCLKSDHWRTPNEKFMLNDSAWLKQTGHKTEISASIDQ
jgi:hypothetical protein